LEQLDTRGFERAVMHELTSTPRRCRSLGLAALLGVALAQPTYAQTATAPQVGSEAATADNAVMLTVFLQHDQSRPLASINDQLVKQGFYKAFPPPGIEVVSWNVVMGIGQIITLRFPASRLREVNRVLEDTAWGPYRTEFYPTYDYKAVAEAAHEKAQWHCQLVGPRLRWHAIRAACSQLRRSGDAADLGPNLHGLGPGGSILGGGHLMAAKQEEVVDPVVGGQEALRLAG